jgi:DNA-binding MarR family transcriptional regulator
VTSAAAEPEIEPSSCAMVTELVTEWAAVRPDLDTWPYRIFASLANLDRAMTGALAPTFDGLGIKGGDYELLSHIRRMGPPFAASPTELSQALYLTTGAMTRRLDRVESAGFLRRLPHDTDRRAIVVQLTPEGVEIVDRAVERILERITAILEPVRDRTAEFESIVRTVLDHLDAERTSPATPIRPRQA